MKIRELADATLYRILRKIKNVFKRYASVPVEFVLYRENCRDLPLSVYVKECAKYNSICIRGFEGGIRQNRVAFFQHKIILKSDKLQLSDNPLIPTVVVLVKDELDRMKLFYDHYRRLGIHQFVMLDNGSMDGTLEWLMEQDDTRVYQVLEPYSAPNKIGWTEKVLALIGYNRWYIVLDSDELLDYPGSESHSAEELINLMHNRGYRRLCGFMVDMYSEQPLFSVNCGPADAIDRYRYFDSNSFELSDMVCDGVRHKVILGGPRKRVFNVNAPRISKQAIFYYDDKLLYRSSHYMSPIMKWEDVPCCFVFRHYKYLKSDEKACMERTIIEKEYSDIMQSMKNNSDISFIYLDSVKYEDGYSFTKLPYVEFVIW